MAKHDSPPFRMTIQNGRLVPASPWDAERLASYRQGAEVNVVLTQETASWRRRKYWSILGTAIKTCRAPDGVRTAQDLHDAIRKEIGFVESWSSDGKQLSVRLKSTSKIDDQEFESYYAEAMEVLSEWTGVDVEEIGREAPDVGSDTQSSGAPRPDAVDPYVDQGSGQSSPIEPAPDLSAGAADQEGDEQPEQADASPSDIIDRMELCLEKFVTAITDKDLRTPRDRQDVLVAVKDIWKKELPERCPFVKACTDQMNRVIKDEIPLPQAVEYLQGLIR